MLIRNKESDVVQKLVVRMGGSVVPTAPARMTAAPPPASQSRKTIARPGVVCDDHSGHGADEHEGDPRKEAEHTEIPDRSQVRFEHRGQAAGHPAADPAA